MKRLKWFHFLKAFLSVALGLSLGLLVTKIAGENPWHVFQILVQSAFGSSYDFGMTLFYSVPLVFTGLAVALPFHVGLFNIGAEGQMTMGVLAAAAAGAVFPNLPFPIAPIFASICAFGAGAIWAAIPGWLRARRGSHEVINTIMFNFIAAGLSSWVVLNLIRNTETQNPESKAIGSGYILSHLSWFGDAPVSVAVFVALLSAVIIGFFLSKTVFGYEVRAVGQSEPAARAAGVDVARVRILAMAVAGGIAGLVGVSEVLGNAGRFRIGFSPGFGFTGIAVALLARNRPGVVLLSALLFGALHKGTLDLDLETENVTRDLSQILQALVILCVSAEGLWKFFGKGLQKIPFRKAVCSKAEKKPVSSEVVS